jgi:hypothetical protein
VSTGAAKPLVHHELCFGCGRANLFGLLAAGSGRPLRSLEVRFDAPVQVGTFIELDASADAATAEVDGRPVASARVAWG